MNISSLPKLYISMSNFIDIYMCVCVCVCVKKKPELPTHEFNITLKFCVSSYHAAIVHGLLLWMYLQLLQGNSNMS